MSISAFISHAHVDNALCDRYVAALNQRGIDVWYDRSNAQTGRFLGDQIQQQLVARSAFVVMLTEASQASFWVQLEIQTYLGLMAKDPMRRMIPVRIGPCTVQPMLNSFKWIDAQAMPFERAIAEIVAGLQDDVISSAQVPDAASTRTEPAPEPLNAIPAHHLTSRALYDLDFRGYRVAGVECIAPPICHVPGSIFMMGSDPRDVPEAYPDEIGPHPVEVAAFAIGQHPVTVAEYACCIKAGVVREPSAVGGMDWAMQQQQPEHPVVCVSWRNAHDYCSWLATLTGHRWRLPSEAEWELAARSAEGRVYPWGRAFDEDRCNTRETSRGTTTPVGHFPAGASPYHLHDMAGNVREWVSSLYAPYPYRQDDGREDEHAAGNRVVRGGSWVNYGWSARSAYRVSVGSAYFNDSGGFRLALTLDESGR